MPVPLLKTKLYVSPLHPEVVPRSHLVGQLENGLKGKLTLISAPAGFGKTTMLKEWIASRVDPVSWVSLDSGDNDPIRFWAYFITALQHIKEGVGESVAAALQTPQPPPLEHLLTDLINDISPIQAIKQGSLNLEEKDILVLDDYHLITDRRVHETVTFFLDHLPPSFHLIIATRADPPWPIARMRARLRVTEIRAEDLRFSLQEATIFLNETMGFNLSPRDIASLEERTEGWIVGLQMAALSMRSREDKNAFIRAFTGTHRYILDYLLEEVLDQQPKDIRSFLLKTSILERMTAELCDAIMGIEDSKEILSHLEMANLFIVSLDDNRSWYRYHHLFSELLKSQLSIKHPTQVPLLNQQASQWFEDNQFVEETIQYAFASKDNERVARLIEDNAMGLFQNSKYNKLSGWIEALPPDLVLKRPWLCVYQAWTRHWAGLREGGEDCLENAEKVLAESSSIHEPEVKRLSGYIAAMRAHYALTNEALTIAIQQARKALLNLPKEDYFIRSTAGIAMGGAYWGEGKVWKAEKAFRDCASDALKGGYNLRASSALCYVGMQQVKQARLHQAEKTFKKSLDLVQDSEGRVFPNAGYPLAKLGELACEWNNLDTAYKDSEQGVELCNLLGQVDLIAEANASLARVQIARKDYSGAENTIEQTDQLTKGVKFDPWAVTWLDDCRIRLWISTNRLDQAYRWMTTFGPKIDGPLNFQHDLSHINLARVLVALSEKESHNKHAKEALDLLHRLSDAAEEAGWLHHKIQILVLIAMAHNLIGERENAINALTSALTLSEPSRYIRTYINEGPPMGMMLEAVLDLQREKSFSQFNKTQENYIKELLSNLQKEEHGTNQEAGETFFEPLTVRELDVLRLLVTNKTVPEIAEELVVSPNTIRSHVKHIYEKLGVHRRLSAVQKAKDLNLV